MSRPFPLNPVLRLREQKEQIEERALVVINADLQQVRAALTRLDQETTRFGAVRQQLTQEVISAAHHQMLAMQWRALQEANAQLRSRLQVLETNRTEQQGRLMTARRDRETLSELHLDHKLRVREESDKAERKRIDDLFSARHGRNLILDDKIAKTSSEQKLRED